MQAKDPRFLPAHDPISTKPPTKTDLQIDATLSAYMDVHMKLETDAEMERRTLVLLKVGKIFKDWVVEVGTEVLKMPEDEAKAAGGELFVSGSHKLGVREPGADIDTICVAPNFCTREHFFTTLKEQFMSHPDVTEFSAAESARVPIMSFDFEGVSIDLLFARLADNVVPAKLDILDDKILSGIDEATEKSLNGPRVTLMIYELVGKEMYPKFLIVLRCIRKWAKCRGLYGNKLGYLGGINCNLLVVLVCQLYPKASPSTLLAFFFRLYGKTWEWPNPVMINKIQQNPPNLYGEQREVWSPESNPFHVMPIITPAYPAMNSSASVSIHTRDIMKAEMARAHDIISKIISERGADWGRLFDPSDFFIKYPHYLCCHILGAGEDEESRSWMGFVESRIGRITQQLETLPLKYPVHFYPVPSKTQKSAHSICYFIGFDIDPKLVRADKNIHIDHAVYQFQLKLNDPERGFRGVRKDGCDFFVEHLRWKQLPKELFEVFGGRDAARARRAEIKLAQGKGKEKEKADAAAEAEAGKDGAADGTVVKEEDGAGRKRKLSESDPSSSSSSSSSSAESKEGDGTGGGTDAEAKVDDDDAPGVEAVPLPTLLPAFVRPWDELHKQNARPFRVPAVSWTLLDAAK